VWTGQTVVTKGLVVLAAAAAAIGTGANASAATWHVRSGAPAGDGSVGAPFATLQSVEGAAGPGDTIVVDPAPRTAPPLDGGIALKPGQKLMGGGPPVAGRTGDLDQLPELTNTTAALDGDAVRLADRTSVRNLVIRAARRGGIYGADVTHVTVTGNDLSATNSSCATGFVVAPFTIPTEAPGVGVPFSSGLPNGWASIMIDASRGTHSLAITRNRVHDTDCADGIDVRASVTAVVSARIDRNVVTGLREGSGQQSVLAIGTQTTDTAQMDARLARNTETFIGSASHQDFGNADSEGLFANAAGRSHLTVHATHNTFAHGLGHISANCVEAVTSNGGPTLRFELSDSTCRHVVGDILEADDLSRDAHLTFTANHVIATDSTYPAGYEQAQVEPGDDGDCLLVVAAGANSTTDVAVRHSQLTNCAADGLGVVSNVIDGSGPADRVSFVVDRTRISRNAASNIRVANTTPVTHLQGWVQRSDLSYSPATPVIIENLDTTRTTHAVLDLGGGPLGSIGHNCILGGGQTDLTTVGYHVAARRAWWGTAGGPQPGRAVGVAATIDSASPLTGADCGPGA
jgi:hypothetical protein